MGSVSAFLSFFKSSFIQARRRAHRLTRKTVALRVHYKTTDSNRSSPDESAIRKAVIGKNRRIDQNWNEVRWGPGRPRNAPRPTV